MEVGTFEAAYRATMPDVYRYLVRATGGDVPLAEDLTQAVFLTAAREHAAGRDGCLTPAWLRTVARNRLIDHHRRSVREAARLPVAAGPVAHAAGPEDGVVAGTGSAAVRALPRLDPDQRVALVLRYLDDLPVREVARLLGRSVRATESLLVRARAALRLAYEREGCDDGPDAG